MDEHNITFVGGYMRQIPVETINGTVTETVYNINELSYLGKLLNCNESKKRGISYLEIPCAFDIETTNIYQKEEDGSPKTEPRPYAFMYHWQFCLDDEVVFGRTWEEFQHLLKCLEKNMNLDYKHRLVVWVHNLPFEWFFMHDFIEFEEGFFLDEKKPAKILTKGGIEFRCSYTLSNMSLQKFCKNEIGVTHYKLEGDKYNYDIVRTPSTKLNEYEESYCYNDVRGLCECIRSRMKEDTLASIPLTSTGYVRRDLRNSVRSNKKNRQYFKNAQLTPEMYLLCREAFRGGDAHANSRRADQINRDGWGRDIKSSYPTSIMEFLRYPFSAFTEMSVNYFLNNDCSDYALIIKVVFINIRYKYNEVFTCGIPYIPLSKCNKWSKDVKLDNGRVLKASFIEMTLTDIDFDIIRKEYKADDIRIGKIYASRASRMSKEIRDTTMDYFRAKCLLDGDPKMKYEYVKAKNKLNSIYGCMVMRIDQTNVRWDAKNKIYVDDTPKLEEAITKFYKSRNNFLQYQQGIFITAFSRLRLREMLWEVGKDVIYCDTDSIKGVGDHEAAFNKKNEELRKIAIDTGAYAEDREGNVIYLGLWDYEGSYEEFKTLGSKKYVYKQNGEIYSTIAGVNKEAGKKYFEAHGVDGLQIGKTITHSGHLTAFYNEDDIHKIVVNGDRFTTASNVALVNNNYKIGVTGEYKDLLLKGLADIIDME